jgi:radical SAM superfamily enzyme YgiQ (UPF0313 family)
VDFVGRIYRPPSEAHSLLLQVSVGCSWNRCSYCDMYRDKQFKVKPWSIIEKDLQEAAAMIEATGRRRFQFAGFDRVFLCDGDALILSTSKLIQILEGIRKYLPWVKRVSTYGDTRSVKKKSVEDLRQLRELGLGMIYHGMETGDDEVLTLIDKGGTQAEAIETAQKLKEAGLKHSVMVLLGVGGEAFSRQHAENTAKTLTRMDPPFVGALTTTVVPETPLHRLQVAGDFTLPGKFAMLQELRTIVSESTFSNCRFSANHASNYLPLRGTLPQDKEEMLLLLDEIIASEDESLLVPDGLRAL